MTPPWIRQHGIINLEFGIWKSYMRSQGSTRISNSKFLILNSIGARRSGAGADRQRVRQRDRARRLAVVVENLEQQADCPFADRAHRLRDRRQWRVDAAREANVVEADHPHGPWDAPGPGVSGPACAP